MLNPTEVLARALGKELAATYRRAFSGREPRYTEVIAEAARLILERIGSSDALYHSAEHTALVALVGQDILRGERLRRNVTPEDWLHFMLATLTHDLGYVRGVCRDDRPDGYVIDTTGKIVSLLRGALMPCSRLCTSSARRLPSANVLPITRSSMRIESGVQ